MGVTRKDVVDGTQDTGDVALVTVAMAAVIIIASGTTIQVKVVQSCHTQVRDRFSHRLGGCLPPPK